MANFIYKLFEERTNVILQFRMKFHSTKGSLRIYFTFGGGISFYIVGYKGSWPNYLFPFL